MLLESFSDAFLEVFRRQIRGTFEAFLDDFRGIFGCF